MYGYVWEAAVGEEQDCRREPSNATDRYAVAVVKSGAVVGHLPKKLSRAYSLIIRRGDRIRCRVTGRRRRSDDLQQGGLEIPCILTFEGKPKVCKLTR